jgi:hypothetical protein
MMNRFLLSLSAFALISFSVNSQKLTQSLKGKVSDKESSVTLPGASILVLGTDPAMGTTTGPDGSFMLENIPIGRYNIMISFVGYDPITIPEVMILSGKEKVLDVALKESVSEIDEVVVKAHSRKDKALNSMASISARSFTVEETRRYAGGLDDPARMAAAFAGVATGNLQDNAIIVRGNSPRGVLWRVEGVEVPNPNHFSGGNVAGGGFVSIISGQTMSNSDFFTGAFPAEYGNALAGVFDINLRTGNTDKREHSFQAGILGIDFASEGPFVKGKKASYLFNYRYSTFGLITNLGVIPTDQIPIYQDLSFKLNFPTQKSGIFTLWGIGAIDNLTEPEEMDSTLWESDWDRMTNTWDDVFGATGLTHKLIIGRNSYLRSQLTFSGSNKKLFQQRLDDGLVLQDDLDLNDRSGKITIGTFFNHKFNARHTNRTGLKTNLLYYNLNLSGTENEVPGTFMNFVDEKGNSQHFQAYSQSKYNITEHLAFNAGLHAEYLAINNDFTLDPRMGMNWSFSPGKTLSFGYGKHSQMEDLDIYFIQTTQNGRPHYPNKDLSFAHAHHFVLGYDQLITENVRLKIEPYFQYLYDVPGMADSSFSMVNFKQDMYFRGALENNSIGQNIGVDFTLERFLNNNFYYLITASVFDSKYKADDGKWRSTRYDKEFVANILVGKEYYVGKNKNNVLGLNARLNIVGGEKRSPILMEESEFEKRGIYDETKAFSEQEGYGNYLNFTLTYSVNKEKYTGTWALQLNNILGSPLNEGYYYNLKTQKIEESRSVVRLPGISYKIDF